MTRKRTAGSEPNVQAGRPSGLMNNAQMAGAKQMHADYLAYASSLSPQLPAADRKALLATKFTELCGALFDTPAFEGAIVEGDKSRNRAAWVGALRRKITNAKSFHKKKNPAGASVSVDVASTKTMSPPGPLDAVDSATIHAMRRGFLLLHGEFTPRELFVYLERETIAAEIQRLKDQDSHILGGALYQHVVKQLWTEEKQQEYANKVDPLAEDIEANQDLFPSLLSKGIADILKRGLLGTALVKVSVAVRDPAGNLTASILYEGYDSDNSEPIAHVPVKMEADAWVRDADAILPRVEPPMPDLPINDDGLPIWPFVNLPQTSLGQIAAIVKQYSDAVWFHAVAHSATNPCFPAEEFADNPSAFLDTLEFKLPTPLPPAILNDNFTLAQFFETVSNAGNPFHFRPADDIAKRYQEADGADLMLAGVAGQDACLAQALGFQEPELIALLNHVGTPPLPHDDDANAAKMDGADPQAPPPGDDANTAKDGIEPQAPPFGDDANATKMDGVDPQAPPPGDDANTAKDGIEPQAPPFGDDANATKMDGADPQAPPPGDDANTAKDGIEPQAPPFGDDANATKMDGVDPQAPPDDTSAAKMDSIDPQAPPPDDDANTLNVDGAQAKPQASQASTTAPAIANKLDELVAAAAAAASLTALPFAGAAEAITISTGHIADSTHRPANTAHSAGGLDALIAAAAASLSPPGIGASSTPTTPAAPATEGVEIAVITVASSATRTSLDPLRPSVPSRQTLDPQAAGEGTQVLRAQRQTRGSLRAALADKGSSSATQSKTSTSHSAGGPPDGSKKKRKWYWKCPVTGDVIEDDELPDDARPAKKPKHTSSTYKENALQGAGSSKARGKKSRKQ
ncbi:hypothetical protein BKA70DRAFT_1398528 [Coprinopsis sp. MPI-PUGE-AT-0042]|nr:hypothetical protein BKA70DRAFT_1398528 [Coprinopsis sp. MPI-PUGE-AT-0042]